MNGKLILCLEFQLSTMLTAEFRTNILSSPKCAIKHVLGVVLFGLLLKLCRDWTGLASQISKTSRSHWPMRGAPGAANHRRALLGSANRGLATTDCSLRRWQPRERYALPFTALPRFIISSLESGSAALLPSLRSAAAAARWRCGGRAKLHFHRALRLRLIRQGGGAAPAAALCSMLPSVR